MKRIVGLTLVCLLGASPALAARDGSGRYLPQGKPYGQPIPFVAPETPTPAGDTSKFIYLLIIGSDARPNQTARMTRQRGDSLHVLVWNTEAKRGTLLGIPRDTMVPIPGHGRTKITGALAYGGPELMTSTVRSLTGLPVQDWIVTGFGGFVQMADGIQGLQIEIPPVNDHFSGAQFSGGWYSANGKALLAFARARKSVPGGDFGRSKNQGTILLAELSKLGAETSSVTDLNSWIDVLFTHSVTSLSRLEVLRLALLARTLEPKQFANIVLPAHPATVGSASVVVVDPAAGPLLARLKATGWPT